MDDPISSTGYDLDDVVDSLRVEGFRNGSQYWLPVSRSTPIMYYNRTLYEAAGLPGPATTYSELWEYGPALTQADSQIYGFGFPGTGSFSWQFQGMVWSFAGAYSSDDFQVTLDQGGAVEAGNQMLQAASDGWLSVSQDMVTDFASGYLATIFASTGSLTNITELTTANGIDFGTAFLPGELPGIDETCPTGGSGLGIFSGVSPERQAAAFAFLSYWSSVEKTTWWAQNTGYMPIRKSAVTSPAMRELFAANPNYKVAVDQLAARTKPQDVVRRLVPTGEGIIGDALNAIVLSGTPAQVAFASAAVALQAEADGVTTQIIALEGDPTTGDATPELGGSSTPGASR